MITKEELKTILIEQKEKFERQQKEHLVIREKLDYIKDFISLKHIIVITGIRRCGKSVFLSQIKSNFLKSAYFINFEDDRFAEFKLKDFSLLHETCIELFGNETVFFIDEVQNVSGWERWVRRMYDNGYKFFITGSNARLLSKELATLLTGRHLQITIFPFSFREMLKFYGVKVKEQDLYITEKRAILQKYFSKYIRLGGFPEYHQCNRVEILQEYFHNIIDRDIVERYNVSNAKQLKELARYLTTNTGNLTTYNKLKKYVEIKSVNTIIKYLDYLETVYLVFKVPFFSFSIKRQMLNPFKIYTIDIGLKNAISFSFSNDYGRIYETVVAVELKRENKEIYYWKNIKQEEVDFVIKKGQKIEQLIQVCYTINDGLVYERETRALLKASKELRCNNLLIINETIEKEEKLQWLDITRKVKFLPLWKWLLKVDK